MKTHEACPTLAPKRGPQDLRKSSRIFTHLRLPWASYVNPSPLPSTGVGFISQLLFMGPISCLPSSRSQRMGSAPQFFFKSAIGGAAPPQMGAYWGATCMVPPPSPLEMGCVPGKLASRARRKYKYRHLPCPPPRLTRGDARSICPPRGPHRGLQDLRKFAQGCVRFHIFARLHAHRREQINIQI